MMKTNHSRHSCVGRNLLKWSIMFLRIPAYAGMTVILLALMLTTTVATFAQNITKLEYFIDVDPGFGLATDIPITAATTIDINKMVEASAISAGFHMVTIRAQNANGVWGFGEKRQFYIAANNSSVDPPVAQITKLECFIDIDPGFGLANDIPISTGYLIDINYMVEASVVLAGFHTLTVRSQNSDGRWGFGEKRQFYIAAPSSTVDPPPADIIALEYFFDVDPGFGLANPLSISAGQMVDITPLIPETLSAGYHFIYIRAKNADNRWGMSEKRPVYIAAPITSTGSISDIAKVEYFFDGNDPGAGQATDFPITPGALVDLDPALMPTPPTLIDGQHEITIRAQNADGQWGMAETTTFDVLDDCTQPIAGFTPQLACASQTVTFTDTSTSLQGDAQYRWYLNGDTIIDDTTVGDATFTYDVPGVYVVALAIRQGTICLDSIATTITIQPEPVAVFSAVGTAVNQPTNFTASANNLQSGAIWEWDFDGDLAVDDNTVGSTSFTYTSEATYNPTLTITDGLGCGITVSNSVIISASGSGGSSPPTANYLPENGCVGNAITFVDLSQNIPTVAIYSWDFDGDGIEDDATFGTTSFTFSAQGVFNAKLTINTGSTIIENTQMVEIASMPSPDFSTISVCEGSVMNFTDESTGATPAAAYMWDFNNDGIIDSNAKTGVAFTYSSQGSYIVKLTISNGFGCSQEMVKQVTVVGLPTPNFDWDVVCTGEQVSFNNLSTNVENNATYSWDLDGDGTEDFNTNGDVVFTYLAKGIYNASLLISNTGGCETTVTKPIEIIDRPEVAIDIIAMCYGQESQMIDLSQKVSPTATYSWDFENDGTEDDNTTGSTVFTYTEYNTYIVNLTVDNGGGCLSSVEELVVFSDAATPDFSINKTCQGEEVVFTDLSTNLETGALYSWDFDGDGLADAATPGSTINTFAEAGTYNATLTIDNGGQCLAFKTILLDVTPPPAVDLGSDLNLCEAGDVTFNAGTGYTSYLWPDGSTNQTYTVNEIGDYMVKVQDAKGCFNTDTISVNLLGPPISAFEHTIELSLEGIKVHFTNTTTNGDTYSWAFGDGATSDETDPTHIYSDFSFYETSVYEVCIISTNACEEATFCENIFVSPTQFLEEGGDAINVYPNPVNHWVNVDVDQSQFDIKSIGLINSRGQLVWTKATSKSNFQLDMTNYGSGVYFLLLEQTDKFYFKRIIKQ